VFDTYKLNSIFWECLRITIEQENSRQRGGDSCSLIRKRNYKA